MDAAVNSALKQFAAACESSDHEHCARQLTCQNGLAAALASDHERESAHTFDVGQAALAVRSEMPQHTWSTSTLLRTVEDGITSQPNINPFWRSTRVTTALARLGERGISADSVVRTCLGSDLLHHVIIVAANVWCEIGNGNLRRADVPELRAWLEAIDRDASGHTNLGEVLFRALGGETLERGRAWLRSAAMAHVIAWRLDATVTEVHRDDLTLPCGESGTRWVFERFTRTYPGDWSHTSLTWETAYRRREPEVAARVGLPVELLRERIVTDEQLDAARTNYVLRGTVQREIHGVDFDEIFDLVVAQLSAGFLDGARILAESTALKAPDDPAVQNMLAFCLVPYAPDQAVEMWRSLLSDPRSSYMSMPTSRLVTQIDLASALIMQGRLEEAAGELPAMLGSDASHVAWLWDPQSLPESPRVQRLALSDWSGAFHDVLNRRVASQSS